MGILKKGDNCIILKGKNFGKKIIIEKLDKTFVYYKLKDKEKKISILQIFPLK
ncbi:MAG: hypothetical protein V1824_00470 [archaeon]